MKLRVLEHSLIQRWRAPGGYREVLVLAAPLILSTGALALQEFVDRMFLSWYSPEAIAAATPAGILHFTILSLFLGTAGYVGTFVAQYHGARRWERIGASVWQGLYVALIGALAGVLLVFQAPALFRLIDHPAPVQVLELKYFRILCLGAFFPVASASLSGFFSGRGRPWPVMLVHALATGINILLNYALIFGNWGFPELGIAGAGISTVISGAAGCIAFFILMMRSSHTRRYTAAGSWKLDRELFGRLLRYGLPSGVQFFVDILGFTVFILLIGRLGTVELAATNIAFNINMLAFMPMLGLGIAVSVLVGQYLGREREELAERSVYSGAAISFFYMGLIAAAYLAVPGLFAGIFATRGDLRSFEPIRRAVVVLLRFVAVYSLFDTMNIVFASGIKGAGDTRFVMLWILLNSLVVLIVPSYIGLVVLGLGLYPAWFIVTAYIICLGFGFLFRFRAGKWKAMRVI